MGNYLKLFKDTNEFEESTEKGKLNHLVNEIQLIKPVNPCSFTTYDFVDLELPSGIKWANKNIGALTETDCGLYFQWGDTKGYTAEQVGVSKNFTKSDYKYASDESGSASSMTKYNTTDRKDTLDESDDAAIANMCVNWHMPSPNNFIELINTANTTNIFTTVNGVTGRLFTSVRNGNTLFFPICGSAANGTISPTYGIYLTNKIYLSGYADAATLAQVFIIANWGCGGSDNQRWCGMSIRGVCD